MLRFATPYALIAGLIVGVPLFALAVIRGDEPPPAWGQAVGYLTMLVAFSTIFVAIKRRRDQEQGGVIRFWPAFGLGLIISAVASVFYVLAWEGALAVTGLDFAATYAEAVVEKKRAAGASEAEIARLTADMRAFAAQYANPAFRLPITFTEVFPVGVLVSAVSAGLLRNSRFLPARAAE